MTFGGRRVSWTWLWSMKAIRSLPSPRLSSRIDFRAVSRPESHGESCSHPTARRGAPLPFFARDTYPKAMAGMHKRILEDAISRAVSAPGIPRRPARLLGPRFSWMCPSLCVVLVFVLGTGAARANEELEKSWNEFMQGLARAQESLTDPGDFPPEPTDRNLAEGYRYMLAHLGRMIEMELRQDPRYPEFNRSVDMLRKWTGENPDAMYLKAPVDATGYYRVSGRVPNAQEWRT